MMIYYPTKNVHRLREVQEVAEEFEDLDIEVHNDPDREEYSQYKIEEYTNLTVDSNEYYNDAITDNNDSSSLVREILAFWGSKTKIEDRMCNLTTLLFVGPIQSDMIDFPTLFTEYSGTFRALLLEQFFDKEYAGKNLLGVPIGYDLDTILYDKKTNRTLSSMSAEQRAKASPRKKAMRKLIKGVFLSE